jgi:ATP-dependent Clp protease ATP-binding subunit ClpB
VFNVLLQVLDDGRMTDGQGRTVDFKNTVIVMTSNLGSQMIQQMSGDDYQVIKLAVMAEVKTYFRPEFINRLDGIMVFRSLSKEEIAQIVELELRPLRMQMAEQEMTLKLTEAARLAIADAGYTTPTPIQAGRGVWRSSRQ